MVGAAWAGEVDERAGTVMYDCVMAFPGIVRSELGNYGNPVLPARMKENVMQVPATPFTMVLSDILRVCFGIGVELRLMALEYRRRNE